MIQTLHLELGARSFPIYIGDGLLQNKDLLISDSLAAPLYLQGVCELLISRLQD